LCYARVSIAFFFEVANQESPSKENRDGKKKIRISFLFNDRSNSL